MKRIIVLLIGLLLLAGCARGKAPADTATVPATTQPQEAPQIKTTLMIYMIGSDLEAKGGAGTKDLEEIAASGVDVQTHNVVVYAGGTPKWHNDTVQDSACAVLHLTQAGFEKAADMASVSMGQAETLTEFLQYGYENYPADRYALVLWDHGNGPVMGYGADELYSRDALLLAEMADALQASPFGKENKLAWVGFDACLMASAELACIWADYADYMVSSQEIEPAFGWDYSFLEQLGQQDVPALLERVSADYMASCLAYYERKDYTPRDTTLSCVDLSKVQTLQAAMEALFTRAAADVEQQYNLLAVSRVQSRALGKATTGSEYDLIDLRQMALQLQSLYPSQAQAVIDALDAMILTNTTNARELCGMSLYYPFYNKKYYEKSWREIYRELGLFPAYQQYLEGFEAIWTERDRYEEFAASIMPQERSQGVYILPLTQEQMETYADAKFYILRQESQGMYNRLLVSANVENIDGLLVANFDGNVIYVQDRYGNRKIPVADHLLTAEEKDHYSIYVGLTSCVPGSTMPLDGKEYELEAYDYRLIYDRNTQDLSVSALVPHVNAAKNEMGSGKTEDVDMGQWTEVLFWDQTHRYLTRDENGTILPYEQWDSNTVFSGEKFALTDGMEFVYEPLDGGTYYVMIEVMDTQGNAYCSELLPIAVADSPRESYAMSNTDVSWQAEEKLLLLDQNGVKLYMKSQVDDWTQTRNYILELENNNSFGVSLIAGEVIGNGNIYCDNYFGSILAPAGETSDSGQYTGQCKTSLENIPVAGEIKALDTLQLTVYARSTATGEYVLEPQTVTVKLSENAPNLENPVPFADKITDSHLGARADTQVVYDDGMLRATLLGFGKIERSSVCGILRVENLSDTTMHFELDGGQINGIYIFSMADQQFHTLQPGQILYLPLDVSSYDLETYHIPQIGALSLLLRIVDGYGLMQGNSQWNWCPVELSVKGSTDHSFVEEQRVIYNENGIRVAMATAPDEDGDYRVTVYNGSQDSICVEVVNVTADGVKQKRSQDVLGIAFCAAGPNQYGTGDLSIYNDTVEEITFCVQIRDMNEEGVLDTSREVITLVPEKTVDAS